MAEPTPEERREQPLRVVLVAGAVCLVCSALVAASVAWLRPIQQQNRERERREQLATILRAAGLGGVVDDASLEIDAQVVDLASGRVARSVDPADFDAARAEQDPEQSSRLPPERDPARIGRRANLARVHVVRRDGALDAVILPIHGTGYLSTLRGYLVVGADLDTVRGIGFFEHAETPGLGSQIQNPEWTRLWAGKRIRDSRGEIRLRVSKGRVDPSSPSAAYEVDGISGATMTSQGVSNLVRFWLGPDGFGPYLERLRSGGRP